MVTEPILREELANVLPDWDKTRYDLSSVSLIVDDTRTGQSDGTRRYESATNKRTGVIIGLRAIAGHSGRTPLGFPSFINRAEVTYRHTRFLWHATKTVNRQSITEVGLLVGGHRTTRRHEMFFSIVDPCQSSSSGSNELEQSALMSQMCEGTTIVALHLYKGDIVYRVDVLKYHEFGNKFQHTVS